MIHPKSLLLLGALTLASTAIAAPPHGPQGKHRGPPPPHELIRKNADELGINNETVDEIVEIAEAGRDEMETRQKAVREASRTLHELLSADQPNRRAVMNQVDVLSEAERAAKKHQLSILMDIRALLTPEQRDAIKALHKRMRRHGPPNGHRGPPPGGHRGPPPGGRGPGPR